MSSDLILVDANILIYGHYQGSEYYKASFALLEKARDNTIALCVTPQVLAEFYAVITNTRRVSSAYQPKEALEAINEILLLPGMSLLPVPIDVVTRWANLAMKHPVTGKDIFDVQLIATMLGNSVNQIYTYNRSDFEKFSEIEVLTP